MALFTGAILCLGACSPLLDTDSLKIDGEPPDKVDSTTVTKDGSPYDASLLPQAPPRTRMVAISAEETIALNLLWEDHPGPAGNADFAITLPGQLRPLFQIFSRNGQPYACTGLHVVPLLPETSYGLNIADNGTGLQVTLFSHSSTDAILESEVSMPRVPSAEGLAFNLNDSARIQMSRAKAPVSSFAALR